MTARDCDMAIIGGGLAGGLIALAVTRQRPDLAVRVFEAGPLGGANRRWSWFSTDLGPEGEALMEPLSALAWKGGYEVHFPERRRSMATAYRSLASADFAADLERFLPRGTIRANCPVASFDAGGVTLQGGERIEARAVIDCRGFVPTRHLSGGWQVFHGCHLRGESQHGIKRPMIMDATVGQSGAFRFVYVLPLSEHEALIEDTYYQTRSSLDEEDVDRRLARYIGRLRWPHELVGVESGALPVIAGGDFDAWQAERRVEGVARAGAHAGFLHPLTGYTLPFAVQTALAVAQAADLSGPALAALLEKRARAHWRATRFYRTLGSLLFGAAQPNERWRVFQRFYRLPRGPIERFYAGRSTWLDKVRIVTGKPPVPVRRAMFALFTSRPRLKKAA